MDYLLFCCFPDFQENKNFFALITHFGIAVSIIGVVGDTQYTQEAVVRMGPGQGRPLGDVIFVYEETRKVDTNSFFADEGKVLVLNKNEAVIDELHPQRQTYKSNGMEMTGRRHFTRILQRLLRFDGKPIKQR